MGKNNKVVTRFAPSPTGLLHIGGVRTALFNYLYAHNQGGKFLLRIEDTDHNRLNEDAMRVIIEGLSWMGLNWQDKIIYQSQNIKRHKEIAHHLIETGQAYYCYMSSEELVAEREKASAKGDRYIYDMRWRDQSPDNTDSLPKPSIRLKTPKLGVTEVEDKVLGKIQVNNTEVEDFIIMRADGNPTYMLAVVVDDHDMEVTNVMRGDDHMTNTIKQILLYQALNWEMPVFAHIPLICGEDGKKLSKRHGATSIEEYKDLGYLPVALRNYLLRLGWSHGDDEIISDEEAIEWFNLDSLSKSPARIDQKKLDYLNGHYLMQADNSQLISFLLNYLQTEYELLITAEDKERIYLGLESLKERSKTLIELANSARFYVEKSKLNYNKKALKLIQSNAHLIPILLKIFSQIDVDKFSNISLLEEEFYRLSASNDLLAKNTLQIIRCCVTYSNVSPGIWEVVKVLGKVLVEERLRSSLFL